jgi:hypothetical protein
METGNDVIVTGTETNKAVGGVVEAASKTEGLKAGIRIQHNTPEGIIIEPLRDDAVGCIHYQLSAAEPTWSMIKGKKLISLALFVDPI